MIGANTRKKRGGRRVLTGVAPEVVVIAGGELLQQLLLHLGDDIPQASVLGGAREKRGRRHRMRHQGHETQRPAAHLQGASINRRDMEAGRNHPGIIFFRAAAAHDVGLCDAP